MPEEAGNTRLSLLLAAAMFVLVVDTSLMNVSIAAVVRDLDTTVSAVQSAIALEALVSAAFILISSKLGDLFGRKRAYVVGLLAYATGAVAMTARPGPDGDHRLLGDHRRLGRFAAAARDAVADPRQLRGSGAEEDLRPHRRGGGDRGGGRAAARGLRHHLSVLARRLPAGGRGHSDRAGADRTRQGRPLHRATADRHRGRGPVRGGDGWRGAGNPGVAGGWRLRRAADRDRGAGAVGAGPLAGAPSSRGEGRRCSTRSCSRCPASGSGSPDRCCRTSRSAGR